MENVVLIIHLLLALALIGVVLLQRSEGGGLGMGGGGGGAMTGRAAATAMGKMTWILAIAFIITSITLTVIAAEKSAGASVIDRLGGGSASTDAADDDNTVPGLGDIDTLLPPPVGDDAPLTPKAD